MPEQSQVLEDYSLQPVPLDKRKSRIQLAVIWIGIAVVMSAIFRGMMIGMGLGDMKDVGAAYLLGEVILIATMALTGYIGARTGLSTPLIANFSFGYSYVLRLMQLTEKYTLIKIYSLFYALECTFCPKKEVSKEM